MKAFTQHIQVAPFIKQVRTKAGAFDRFQKLLRDDLVGVDVGATKPVC